MALAREQPAPEPQLPKDPQPGSPGPRQPTRSAQPAGGTPKLAPGIELIGEYEDSGFKEAPYIARRADGQVVQMSHLLYTIAQAIDGSKSYEQIAEQASQAYGKRIDAGQAQSIVEKKLRQLGVVADPDGTAPDLKRVDPMTALNLRASVVPEGIVRALTTGFKPLFFPPVVLAVLAGLVVLDAYVFFFHGVAQGLRELLYNPALMLLLLVLIILSAAFHEIGHATACAYGGAKPGVLGAGIYMIWPAFYSDVTDAYRLGKGGRLRTDLGGVYFNVIFMLGTAAAYFVTHWEPLLLVIALQNIEIVHQFLPFLRLDGYYVVADLTGVPDIFGRVKPVLHSLVPGADPEPKVTELKGWVRVAVTIWVLITVPMVLFIYGMLLFNAPRIFATAWDSLQVQTRHALDSAGHGNYLMAVVYGLQAILLVLPSIGLVYTFILSGKRIGGAVIQRTEGRPLLRTGAALLATVLAGLLVWAWLPHGRNYTPIRPTETGTISVAFNQIANAPLYFQGVTPSPAPEASPGTTTQGGSTQPTPASSSSPVNTNTVPSAAPSSRPSPSPS